MASSEDISRQFYDELGAEGLAKRTRPEWDEQILVEIEKLLSLDDVILDLGCGYGRITLPLASRGYQVRGLDLSPELVRAAEAAARQQDLPVAFEVGSMSDLPYDDDSFDAVLLLWSAFHELLEPSVQLRAVREIDRVLRSGGWALAEGPLYTPATDEEIASDRRYGPEHRIAKDEVNGQPRPGFRHDNASFAALMQLAGIDQFEYYTADWGGRDRQILRFWKS